MDQKVFFITPPFTQLNTPYPATAYLKGFLNTLGVAAGQADMGMEVILSLFSPAGLKRLFAAVAQSGVRLSANGRRIVQLSDVYCSTIGPVIDFLQDKNPTLAHSICTGNYLPEASRFNQLADLEWAFGAMGIRDKARHLATLYLEDLSDLIVEAVDPHFGFSRYAERLGRSAASFDALDAALRGPLSFIDELLLELLATRIVTEKPTLVALSVPFPGNLYSAFKCGQWLKEHYPEMKVCLGGGYANTELRGIRDPRVFDYVDFITLDDGEAPLVNLLEYLEGKRPVDFLKRTFVRLGDEVVYCNASLQPDYKQIDVGTPDYSGLRLDEYLSVIEIANPMHRLWSDGRWNKLTLAHGCYWGKCTFCDISLDYIRTYEATTAVVLVDRMETIMRQTGQNGFHFVDEAAPPALMREVALELLRRKLSVTWWTNIRFEKSFTADLCRLLAASGCIAVSGGLEVASDRLLNLIKKGVTVAQVAKVAANFTEAGIMVHAYLMYGFPTQTAQETIDALEVVRQLFALGIVQSGFWHQFAMTAHSPVGMDPAAFKVKKVTEAVGAFAHNDMEHTDPTGTDHERFSAGLRKSLFNYMHGICFDFPLQEWFDFKVPRTGVEPDYIEHELLHYPEKELKPGAKIVWLGDKPVLQRQQRQKKGKSFTVTQLVVYTRREELKIAVDEQDGAWLETRLPLLQPVGEKVYSYAVLAEDYQAATGRDFESLWQGPVVDELRQLGLLAL
ncbi:B12-binding domain-containing radical SAM protein [Taibaiella koreensis]|uniref:B12-binding domain-containing radical SAM protein n=1 Tax=Taibaiella koreensis TaxID=1268548 RepID=UPI000E5A00CE|nr:radical SAM protein [Taibaiella koreensis]